MMSQLINQAFQHIHSISAHVREGHYDLEGPEGELILRNIWDTTIQPGWQITMKMWPDLELLPVRGAPQPGGAGAFPPGMRIPAGMTQAEFIRRAQQQRPQQRPQQPPLGRGMPPVPPMPPMQGGMYPRPPQPPAGATFGMFPGGAGGAVPRPAAVDIVDEPGRRHHKKVDKDKKKAALGWLGGRTGSGSKKK